MKFLLALASLTLLAANAHASAVDALTLEQLQDQSALVVVGYVTATATSTLDGETMMASEIAVVDCLAGLCPEDLSITGPAASVEGAPRFVEGQEVLVFLRPASGGFAVVGMAQGLFQIERNGANALAVSNRAGLDMIEPTGRPNLVETLAYPLDELVDGIRLGLPVTPVAQN